MGKKKNPVLSATSKECSASQGGTTGLSGAHKAQIEGVWNAGDDVSDFRLRMRDIFTQTELDEVGADVLGEAPFRIDGPDETGSLIVRQVIRAVFVAHFLKGRCSFHITGSAASTAEASTGASGDVFLTVDALYRCKYYERHNVPLLACKWSHSGMVQTGQPNYCTIVTTKEAVSQFLHHLQDAGNRISNAKQAIQGQAKANAATANKTNISTAAGLSLSVEHSAFLLPAYPSCGPTRCDLQSGQFIEHTTAVETHHYFVKDECDTIMIDAEDRMYFFLSRDDAGAWALAIGFAQQRREAHIAIVGVGDDMWKSYQRGSKITLVTNASVVLERNLGKNYKRMLGHARVQVQRSKSDASERPSAKGSKLDLAEGLKVKGNQQFQLKIYREACKYYSRGAAMLQRMGPSDRDAGSDRWRQLLVACLSNSAECYLQLKDGQTAQRLCTDALRYDREHAKSKSRYRRSLELLSAKHDCHWRSPGHPSHVDEGTFLTMDEYFSRGDFELGVCVGLAENASLLTKPGKLDPLFAEIILRPCSAKDTIESGFLKVVLALYDMAHGGTQARSAQVLIQLESYINEYRSRSVGEKHFEGLLFASLTLHGVLQANVFGNNLSAVKSLKEAWEMPCSQSHPWQEFLLARAYGGLSEQNHVEAGLHHFKSVVGKYKEHLKHRPRNTSTTAFVDDAHILVLGVHIHYETAMQHWMRFQFITCKKAAMGKAQIADVCAQMRALRDDADALEEQFKEECPWDLGIVSLPAREYCNKFLAEHCPSTGRTAEKLEKAKRERARQNLKAWFPHLKDDLWADDAASSGDDNTVLADIIEITSPAQQQHSLDQAKKRLLENHKNANAAYESGQADAFDPESQRLFGRAINEHRQHSLEMEELLAARTEAVEKAERRLDEVMAGVHAQIQSHSQDIGKVVFEQAKIAEAEFSRRELELRQEHEHEMKELNERLESEMKGKEAAFRKAFTDLQLKRADAQKMFAEKLQQKASEEERWQLQEMRLNQDLASMREDLAHKDRLLEESHRELENRKAAIEAEKMELEQKYAETWSKTQMPATWTLRGAGDGTSNREMSWGFKPVHITDQKALSALQKCLSVCRADFLGDGSDYLTRPERPYSRLHLASAWRVENPVLMEKYMAEKRKMCADLKAESLTVSDVTGSLWLHQNGSIQELPEGQELDSALNETFLLHGTRPVTIPKIMHAGLNERVNQRGFFGSGTYLAEDAGKADQYTGLDWHFQSRGNLADLHRLLYSSQHDNNNKPKHAGVVFYMFLCRAALGYPVHSFDGDWSVCGTHNVRMLDRRNRNTNELSLIPRGTTGRTNHHSLIIEKYDESTSAYGWKPKKAVKRYREFVFTHSDRTYPQYLLAVQRV